MAKRDAWTPPPAGATSFNPGIGVSIADPVPTECNVCQRGARFLARMHSHHGGIECSHVDCPHRKRLTASGGGIFNDGTT
jgi:hypothetical protein